MSIQGVQAKLSARLRISNFCFDVVDTNGTYILNENLQTMEYYKSELAKLGKLGKDDSIKLSFEGKSTNYIALNKDSLKVLKEFFNSIKL